MTADRNRILAARVGGLAVAVGAGAVIACSAAVPAWANEDAASAESTSSSDTPSSKPKPAKSARHADTPDTDAGDQPGADAPEPDGEHADDTTDATDADADTDVEPAPAGTVAVRTIDDSTAPEIKGDTAPEAPDASPGVWTLLGSARRDTDDVSVPVPLPDTTSRPVEEDAASVGAATTVAPVPDGPAWEALYTGKPSFIHDVVTFGLYVIKTVLQPFGGLLAFTSLKIPFLTDGIPPFFLTGGLDVERTEFEGMKVWTLTPRKEATDKVVVALHGGAYVATASIFHWWTYADMARDTGATVVVPLQTLVTKGGTAASEVPRTANFLTKVIDDHGADNVSVFGDSAGGGLALAAMQELTRRNSRKPARLVLLAPWLDVSMSDPRSAQINDPLLDLPNLRRSGAKWAGAAGTADPLASPLFGALEGLPPTYVYSSSLDLLTADTLRLRERVLAEDISDVTFRLRKGLIHDWFTFPFLPDAHEERDGVYQDLLGSVSETGSPANRLATK